MVWKTIKDDRLPEVGRCLIVTVRDHFRGQNELDETDRGAGGFGSTGR